MMKALVVVAALLWMGARVEAGEPVWQPSAGHAQVPLWPVGAVPDARALDGDETVSEVNDNLVAGKPWR